MASPRETFVGRWRIASMDAWDELDLLGPAFIDLDGNPDVGGYTINPSTGACD